MTRMLRNGPKWQQDLLGHEQWRPFMRLTPPHQLERRPILSKVFAPVRENDITKAKIFQEIDLLCDIANEGST